MMLTSPTGAFILFAVGLWIVIGLVVPFVRVRRLHFVLEHAANEVLSLLDHRANHLPDLLRDGNLPSRLLEFQREIGLARTQQQNAGNLEDRLVAEQAISLHLIGFEQQARHETTAVGEIFPEIIEMEPSIAIAREHYNAAATAWNQSRSSFPANILSRAMGWSVAPLFRSQDMP